MRFKDTCTPVGLTLSGVACCSSFTISGLSLDNLSSCSLIVACILWKDVTVNEMQVKKGELIVTYYGSMKEYGEALDDLLIKNFTTHTILSNLQ